MYYEDDKEDDVDNSDQETRQSKKKSASKHHHSSKKKHSSKSSSVKKSKAIIDDSGDDDDITAPPKAISSNKNKSSSGKLVKSKKIIEKDDDEDEDNEDEDAAVARDEEEDDDEDDDDDDDDDDDEDEEDEAAPEEFNDFINDNIDEEVEENNEEDDNVQQPSKKKKKKSKKKSKNNESKSSSSSSEQSSENSELSDDDLALIKDNLNVDNLEEIGIKKKRTRIQVASESSEEEKIEPKTKERKKSSSKSSRDSGRKAHEARLSRSQNERENEEAIGEDEGAEAEEVNNQNSDESDEGGSFIVDDSDNDSENKDTDRDKSRNLKKKKVYTDEAQQEAMDIFGVNAEELGAVSDEDDNENDEDEEDLDDDAEDLIEDEENEEEQMDDDDDLTKNYTKKRQRQRRLKALHKIEDIFEPQELEKGLITEVDQQIRLEDKPERFMLRAIPVTSEPNETELEIEAEWIFNQAFSIKLTISNQEHKQPKSHLVIPKIKDTLNFIRNEYLEVPFIASYRKEVIHPDLDIDDLWKIYEMDQKYCQLKQRKENLVKLFQRMQKFQFEQMKSLTQRDNEETTEEDEQAKLRLIEMIRPLDDKDIDRVKNVQTVEEFLDCYHHFHLHYGSDLIPLKEFEAKLEKSLKKANKQKQNGDENEENDEEDEDLDDDIPKFTKFASKKDVYHHCKVSGLNSFAKKIGLTPEQYGENLQADYQKHEIDQWSIEPNMLASDFLMESSFKTTDQVLTTVRYMISIQLAKDPTVRQYVRDLYTQRVCLNVKPTIPKGFKEIDENHYCYPYKYLKMKPCVSLKQDEYLKLAIAEQDALITIQFETSNMTQPFSDMLGGAAKKPNQQSKNDNDWDDDVPSSTTSNQPTASTTASASFHRTIIDKLKSFYLKDEFSYNVEQWNLQRAQIIEEMCTKFLFPEFEKELRSKLLYEAKQHVFIESARKLKSILKIAPYVPDLQTFDGVDDDASNKGLTVLSITFSTGDEELAGSSGFSQSSVCAYVDGDGDLVDFIRLEKLTVKLNREQMNINPSDTAKMESLHMDKREKIQDLGRLEDFILEKMPKVIVVATENKDALTVVEDVTFILKRLIEDNPNNQKLEGVKVELIDNEMPKLYEASERAERKTTGPNSLPGIVKQAIAMARFIQDPLLCYTQLCNQERDILSLKLHPMQQQIITLSGSRNSEDSTELLRMLEIEFINAVNDVGVDLNRCNQSSHTANSLQYVCGLGPRKAQHILKVLRQQRTSNMNALSANKQQKYYPVAFNRLFLVTKCTLGRRVLINCAGFIKFDVNKIEREKEKEDDDEEEDIELLDSTRIHPETYEWARKMAIDALDFDDNNDLNSANSASALREIFENPKRLKDLDLDAFAAELMRTGHGDRSITLYDIRNELSKQYRDKRIQFQSMGPEERFYCLTKETITSFYVGKLIMCRVVGIARKRPNKEQLDEANPIKDENTCLWICSFCKRCDFNELNQVWMHFDNGECPGPPVGVRTQLDNGCQGFIPLKALSDNPVTNPDDRIKVGMIVHARIRKIEPERFNVELTTKTSDLRDVNDKWKPPKDEFYDYSAQDLDINKLEDKKKKEEHRQTYTKRVIAHPQFKNVGYQQAVAYLRDMEIGDAIIRPSSKGSDHLTVTWKVNDNCFQHIDVLEEKKQNSFSVGKRLIIEGEDFEDLDEILARLVSPMANYVREIMAHKNFNSFSAQIAAAAIESSQTQNNLDETMHNSQANKLEYIEQYLTDERTRMPAKIPYVFTCCKNLPGKFMLSYMIKLKLRNEYITVTHEGFKFRQKIFRTFNELVAWFKVHFNDPIPVSMKMPAPPVPPSSQAIPPSPRRSANYKQNDQQLSSQMSSMQVSSDSMQNSYSTSHNDIPNQTHSYSTDQATNNDEDWDNIAFGSGDKSKTNNTQSRDFNNGDRDLRDYRANNNRGGGSRGGFNNGGDRRNNDGSFRGGGRGSFRGRDNNERGSYRGGGRGAGGFRNRNEQGGFNRESTGTNYQKSNNNNPPPTEEDWDAPSTTSANKNTFSSVATPQHVPNSQTPRQTENWDDDQPISTTAVPPRDNRFSAAKTPSHSSDWDQAPSNNSYNNKNNNQYSRNNNSFQKSNQSLNRVPSAEEEDWDAEPIPRNNNATNKTSYSSVATPQHVPNEINTNDNSRQYNSARTPQYGPTSTSTSTSYNAARTPHTAPTDSRSYSAARTPQHSSFNNKSNSHAVDEEDWDAEPNVSTNSNFAEKRPVNTENRSFSAARTPQYTPNEPRSYNAARTPQHSAYNNNSNNNSFSNKPKNYNRAPVYEEDWDAEPNTSSVPKAAAPPIQQQQYTQPPPARQNPNPVEEKCGTNILLFFSQNLFQFYF